jgi:hypothetical protein
MINLLKMVGVLVATVIIPLVVLLAIWMDLLPQIVQIGIAQFAVYFAIVYICGGMLYMMYSDIKTKRYSKK